MKRKIFGVIFAVVLAGLGAFVIVSYVRGVEARALAGERATDVLVVNEAVAAGTPAEDLAASMSNALVPEKVRADGSVDDLADLEGLVAAVDLLPGEQVVRQRFLDPDELAAQGALEAPDGLHQVSVSLESQRALGGRLQPGDTVGVIASFTNVAAEEEENAPDVETTHLILHKVLVTHTHGGPQTDDGEEDSPAVAGGVDGRVLVTLAVSPDAAERIVFAAEHGSLWLTQEPADAPEGGTRVQTKETIYR